jgi:hypothetical protein
MRLRVFLISQEGLRDEEVGQGFIGGRRSQMVAAWSIWRESSVVNFEARVSRASGEAVEGGVLIISAWREAVWVINEGVLFW